MTVKLAVAVLPPSLPFTVCAPATVAVQIAPVHEPFGAMVKVVEAVTSPRLLLLASKPVAVYAWLPPAGIVAVAGLIVMRPSAPAVKVTDPSVFATGVRMDSVLGSAVVDAEMQVPNPEPLRPEHAPKVLL